MPRPAMTEAQFLDKIKHRFNLSLVIFNGYRVLSVFSCIEHGPFAALPVNILRSTAKGCPGCPKCADDRKNAAWSKHHKWHRDRAKMSKVRDRSAETDCAGTMFTAYYIEDLVSTPLVSTINKKHNKA